MPAFQRSSQGVWLLATGVWKVCPPILWTSCCGIVWKPCFSWGFASLHHQRLLSGSTFACWIVLVRYVSHNWAVCITAPCRLVTVPFQQSSTEIWTKTAKFSVRHFSSCNEHNLQPRSNLPKVTNSVNNIPFCSFGNNSHKSHPSPGKGQAPGS